MHPTSPETQNLGEPIRRYVKNMITKSSFSFSPPKFRTFILLLQLLFYYFPYEAHFRPQNSRNESPKPLHAFPTRIDQSIFLLAISREKLSP